MIFRKPYRVVVIDDDESMLDLMRVYLTNIPHDQMSYSLFSDPKEAMAFIRNHLVHIVITDIHLGEEDGDGGDIISDCLSLEKGIQIIAMTNDSSLLTSINCYNRGARYILSKPFVKDQLLEPLKDLFLFFEKWHELIKDKLSHEEVSNED